jgi:AraC family transcriptional regulator
VSATDAPALARGEFYGLSDERWHTGLVKLTLLRHVAPRRVPSHSHVDMFLALLLRGGYREWVGEREISYAPLTAVFHPERLVHSDEILAADSLFFTVEASPALLGGRERRHRGVQSIRELGGGSVVWALLRLLDSLRRGEREPLECEEPVSEILDELLGRPETVAARPRWLRRVEDRLHDEYRRAMSLDALAGQAGVHPVHLSRVFRRHHGGTIRAYVHRLRVLHACRLITRDEHSLADAAIDSGFCDQSHMNRVFTAVTGMTPAAYRRTARG